MSDPIGREIKNLIFIVLGAFSAGMGLHGFLKSSNFIDGGVTGICMLVEKITGWPLALLIPVINLPFVVVGFRHIGKGFAVRSCVAIAILSLVLASVKFPDVTPDLVLTAVFGGFFIGAGIGLAIRGGGVLDGTEIAALLISKRSGAFRVGDVILLFNTVLFLCAISILGVEEVLYSILTYVAAARTLDFVMYGLDEYTAITIISPVHEAIRTAIVNELGRGVTVYTAKGGVSGQSQDVLYSVVTRLEIGKVKAIAQQFDSAAFIIVHSLADVSGGNIKRSLEH